MTGANFASDEELFRRLKLNLHEAASEATRPARRTRLAQETNEMFEVLAGRIYDQPDRWGLTYVPQAWRDEIAHDMLLALLQQASGAGIKSGVAEWFAREVKHRFQAASEKFGATASEPARPVPGSVTGGGEQEEAVAEDLPSALLDTAEGPWQRFEQQFPKEALTLRLKYLLNQTPEKMMSILNAPSTGAVGTQLRRSRERMRTFLESAGYDHRTITKVLDQLGTDQG